MRTQFGTILVAVAAASVTLSAQATTYTSASYVKQDHLIVQWDGINNVGTGTHDPSATTWKDLKGGYDLTLTANGHWTGGNALSVSGKSATRTGAAPAAKTLEVVFKMTNIAGRPLFYGGNQTTKQMVIFDNAGTQCYFEGLAKPTEHRYVHLNFDKDAMRAVTATFASPGSPADAIYCDGAPRDDGTLQNGWGDSTQKIIIGNYADRTDEKFKWFGELYAIRMYDCVLTPEEIVANHAIDLARFSPPDDPTSADYVQDGLLVQWDGIDNEGTGTHNPNATVWKDLKGTCDLTLTSSAAWNAEGRALVVSGMSATGSGTAPAYKTIEVVHKMTTNGKGFLFTGGSRSYEVICENNGSSTLCYFAGDSYEKKYISRPFSASEVCFYSARYGDDGKITDVFKDAEEREDGTTSETWGPGEVVAIGNRSSGTSYPWHGEVYAIRLYSKRLTKAELAHNHRIDCKRFLTTSSYIQENLMAHWDGKDNVGYGIHDSSTNVWKNLVSGGQDLSLVTGRWTDNAFVCRGENNVAALGTASLNFTSLETVFLNGTNEAHGIVLSGANGGKAFVLGKTYAFWKNNSGTTEYNCFVEGRNSLAWRNNGAVFANGDAIQYEELTTTWTLNMTNVVQIGARWAPEWNTYPYKGDIFAIRAYSSNMTDGQIAYNSRIDRIRFGLPTRTLTWNGPEESIGDGFFATNGNWRVAGHASQSVPSVMDAVVLPDGVYVMTLDGERVVDSLVIGAGAALKFDLPSDATATNVVRLTVFGKVEADAAARLVLDAAAFGRVYTEGSATLLACDVASPDALQNLADNVSFVGGRRLGRVEVAADGKSLVYTAVLQGTMIYFK